MSNRSQNNLNIAISAVISLFVSVPAQATETPPAKADLPNFHEVHPYLYRGGEPSDAGLAKLKEMGIKKVIDLRGAGANAYRERTKVEALGMRYLNLPMDSQAPSKELVKMFLDSVEEAKEAPAKNKSVFVHCQHGSDRTGCLVGIWRVTHDGYSYNQAYKEMLKYYFGAKFTNLSSTVRQYEPKAKAP